MPPAQAEQAAAPLASAGARRPLIAATGDVVGFEFRISDEGLQRLQRRAYPTAQTAHVTALLTSVRLIAQAGRVGLARVPAPWLVQAGPVDAGVGSFVAIEPLDEMLPQEDVVPLVQVISQLRLAGARIGWGVGLELPLAPDFVLLRQGHADMAALLAGIATWPASLKGLPVLATDMASVEDIELALAHGMAYVCGALASRAGSILPKDALPVPPEVGRVGHLLNQLVTGAETDAIVSQIKGDVGLSFRLLRRINSASFAQLHASATIEQAVLLLGRNELYRWLSMLLVQFAGQRKTASALQEVALWRSRLLELMAMARHEESPGQLFTLGLASSLGLLLNMRAEDVARTLNLPEPAQDALLHHKGPWRDYLELAQIIENDAAGLADLLTEPYGGADKVMQLSDEAWAWAATHAEKGSPA